MVKAFRRTKEVSHCVKCVFLVRSYPFERSNVSFELSFFEVNENFCILRSFYFSLSPPFFHFFFFFLHSINNYSYFREVCNEEFFLFFFSNFLSPSFSLIMREVYRVTKTCLIVSIDVNSVSSWCSQF